jgi:hypothetical protein
MRKAIYLITLILVIVFSSICFAADNFEADSRAMYTELRHMGMNFDMGINYVNYKEQFRKLYFSYNDYIDKYPKKSGTSLLDTPDEANERVIGNSIISCFRIYDAVNTLWEYDVTSRVTNIHKVDWIWNEFPELNNMHRDWLGGYDTKKVMWTILGDRHEREEKIEAALDKRYSKK